MMDATPLYDRPYHPRRPELRRDFKGKAKAHTRTERPVTYYLIDFGLSRRYDLPFERPLEEPILGGDKTVPEFQNISGPCDPFPTDVYYLGNMVRRTFLEVSGRDDLAKSASLTGGCRVASSTAESVASSSWRPSSQRWYRTTRQSGRPWTRWSSASIRCAPRLRPMFDTSTDCSTRRSLASSRPGSSAHA